MSQSILVVPCYNEEKRFNSSAFKKFFADFPDILVLFVDDGSSDKTSEILTDLCRQNSRQAELQRMSKNGGKAEAVRQGFLTAFDKGALKVGYWDADLATPLDVSHQIFRLMEARPDLEIIMGSRVKLRGREIQRMTVRHCVRRMFATGASMALALGVCDTQCGAKVFRNTAEIRQLFATPFMSRWIFDVEILARYLSGVASVARADHAKRIYEYPLHQWKDVPGTKLKWTDFFRAFFELSHIARRYPLWLDVIQKK